MLVPLNHTNIRKRLHLGEHSKQENDVNEIWHSGTWICRIITY